MILALEGLKEYETALKYYAKIPRLLKQLENEGYDKQRLQRSWLSYHNNLGTYYNEIDKPQEAQKYFEMALADPAVDDSPKLKAMLLNNYANNLILQRNNNVLIDSLLNLSLQIRQDINHKQGIIASKINIAEFKLSLKDTAQALQIMQDAYLLALNEKSGYELMESLRFLSEYDQENRDKYTAVYIQTQDSLRNLERQTRNKFARIAYETNEIEKRNDILIQRNTYLWAIISLVSVLLLIVFIVFKLRLKNKKLLYLQKEQQAVQQIQDLLLKQQSIAEKTREKERKRIAKDLHDAIVNRVFTTWMNLPLLSRNKKPNW
jgi:tetratricopeptide (TPR) repeat protein